MDYDDDENFDYPACVAEEIVEACRFKRMERPHWLIDYSPLVAALYRVQCEIEDKWTGAKDLDAKKVLQHATQTILDNDSLECNTRIPCRNCDQAFIPVVDEMFIELFLQWRSHLGNRELLAIHKCRACGGTLRAVEAERYKGDFHTPEPGSIEDDDEWCETLMEHCCF